MTRLCPDCGADLSDKHNRMLRCGPCATKRKLAQTREWNTEIRDNNRRLRAEMAEKIKKGLIE